MATSYYWVGGAGSQSFNSSANWSATEGGSGGAGVPGDTDTPYILTGTSNIEGFDATVGGTVTFANIYISFNGTIGSVSSPLKFALAANAQSAASGNHGELYLNPVLSNSTKQIQFLGTGPVILSGSTNNQGIIICGTQGPVTVEATYQGAFTISTYGATVTLLNASGMSGTPAVTVWDGLVRCYRTFATVQIYGGRFVSLGTCTATGPIRPQGGGIYTHNTSGAIGSITVFPGGIANTTGATSPFTISATAGLHLGGHLFEEPTVVITYSGSPAVRYYGFSA
jgi:hypothetical protein